MESGRDGWMDGARGGARERGREGAREGKIGWEVVAHVFTEVVVVFRGGIHFLCRPSGGSSGIWGGERGWEGGGVQERGLTYFYRTFKKRRNISRK